MRWMNPEKETEPKTPLPLVNLMLLHANNNVEGFGLFGALNQQLLTDCLTVKTLRNVLVARSPAR
jgi:hypothetical protein